MFFSLSPARKIANRAVPRHRGSTLTLLLAAIATVALLMGVVGYYFFRDPTATAEDPLIHVVERGKFLHLVDEKGEIESSNNVEVRCKVKARKTAGTEILWVIEEGTEVIEGQELARLDSSGLKLDLVEQQITCSTTEAAMIKAKNALAAAEIAKEEYEKGKYYQEKQNLDKAIFAAEEDLRRKEQAARYSERLAAKGYVTELQLDADRFAVEQALKELQSAKMALEILEKYTKRKELGTLEANIKTAEADFKAKQRSHGLELENQREIETQIAACTVTAPTAGTVVHANRKAYRSSTEFIVEPGSSVRENQVLFRLPDPKQMQAKVHISETEIGLIEVDDQATIRLGTGDERVMHGQVTHVSEYPEPSWYSSSPKEYAISVRIDDPPQSPPLRPGLTAKVQITVDEIDDVLQVPVQAVHLHGVDYYGIVQNDQGAWLAAPVEIGATNDEMVVVRAGVQEGTRVTLTPERYLDRVDLPETLEEEPQGRGNRRPAAPPSGRSGQ